MIGHDTSYYITDKNDIFVFFEVIRLGQPERMLDIGMFLKRIGAVSRNVKDFEIPKTTILDAYTLTPEREINIYKTIYDNIYIKDFPKVEYDLVTLIRPEGVFSAKETANIIKSICCITRRILVDDNTLKAYKGAFSYKDMTPLSSENSHYKILFL